MIDIPIILLTAKDFEKDKVEGFALVFHLLINSTF